MALGGKNGERYQKHRLTGDIVQLCITHTPAINAQVMSWTILIGQLPHFSEVAHISEVGQTRASIITLETQTTDTRVQVQQWGTSMRSVLKYCYIFVKTKHFFYDHSGFLSLRLNANLFLLWYMYV